jgi:prevent-host-death family protein
MRKNMKVIDIHEAKVNFSKLVDAAIQGKEILIAVAGKPVARLIPMGKKTTRKFGVLKGNIKIAKDFDARFSEELLNEFEDFR